MGSEHPTLDPGKETLLQLPARLRLVADSRHIERLKTFAGALWTANIEAVPLPLERPLDEEIIEGAEILVVEVDAEVPASMHRVEWVRSRRLGMPLVVALANADLGLVRTLVRQGVSDVVSLPLDPEELLQAALSVVETRTTVRKEETRLAPLIAVVRSLGGSGATSLLTNLARQLTERENAPSVCIFDLDVQFGRVADVLDLHPRRTLSDLLEAGSRIDASLLRAVAVEHQSGVSVIAAPQEIVPLEAIDGEEIRRIIELARREYDFVLLDMPSNWSSWSLSLMLEASSILMVVEQNIASLRQARRRLDLFASVGIGRDTTAIVVNRVEKRLFGSISLSDIAETLHHEVLCGLRADPQILASAQDQGLLVSQVKPKSAYAADIARLADMLLARLPKDAGT